MPAFLLRLLRRLLILTLILGVLGVAAFTWLCYWPLEGGQERVEDLVPGSAEFLVRTTWSELEQTGFLQRNLRDDPLLPPLGTLFQTHIRPLLDQIAGQEAQINAQIPLGLVSVSLKDDLVPGEIVAAGRWCRDLGPPNPPSWREVLVLLRVSWKVRAAIAALDRGFVRDQVRNQSGLDITPSDEPGVFKVVLPGVRVSEPRSRALCGDGFVIPPENIVYLARVRDVVLAGNSLNLIAKAVDLGRAGAGGEPFSSRPGFHLDAPPGSVAAAMDLSTLQPYLTKLLDWGGNKSRLFKYFMGIEALDRMNGYLALGSPDLLAGRSTIRLATRGLGDVVQENYARAPLELRGGMAAFLPAADTFALVQLRTDPLHMLNALYDGVLSPSERGLWADNLRASGLYPTLDAFFRDVARQLGDSLAIASGRLSGLYDAASYPTFDSNNDKARPYNAEPALAVLVTLRQGAKPAEVDEFLAARVHLLGFSKEIESVTYKGFTYRRLKFERGGELAELQLYRPAYLLVQDKLVLASHEDYFRRILDTFAEPEAHPALSSDPTFQVTMEALPEQGHLSLFVDAEKLTRVPTAPVGTGATTDPSGGPRGFLWDRRNWWAWTAKDPRQKAIELRGEITRRYGSAPITAQQDEAIENEVQLRKQAWKEQYPQFLEEYRNELQGYRRARSVGTVLLAQGDTLRAEVVALFREREAARAR